jgi:four helix bundle protein
MFRFEELDIWKKSIEILDQLLNIADQLTEKSLYRFAEQLRGAAISISNNIAEGAGCRGKSEFIKFLGYSRRSAFEVVNMLSVFYKRKYIPIAVRDRIVNKLEQLCKMISGFIKTLSS